GLQCLGTAMWTGSSGRSSIKCTARSLDHCTKLQWVFFTQHHKVLIEVGHFDEEDENVPDSDPSDQLLCARKLPSSALMSSMGADPVQ
ncbi:unnamed protein product, partial [Sphagnum compactum]